MSVKKLFCKGCDKLADAPLIGPIVKPKPKVGVLRLSGVITDSVMRRQTISHAKYAELIDEAFDVYNLQAVALVINSPGGSPAQSALIGHHIRRLSEEKDISVYAFIEDVAASGGYWLACAADKIYAQDVSIIGSIGVISASFGFQDLIDRYGIERRIHTSGKDKSFLDPFMEEKAEDVKRLKNIQKDIHQSFIQWVETRRGDHLSGTHKDLFEGQFWTGEKAKALGLIDGLGDLYSVMKETFGDDIRFKHFEPKKKLFSSLLGADADISTHLFDGIYDKAQWQRYGL